MNVLTKVERQVHFMLAQAFDTEDTTGKNNTWDYNRAPDGYLFQLLSCDISVVTGNPLTLNNGIFNIVDGHEYTHWNIAPGVECRELLGRCYFTEQQSNHVFDLHGWECKEYTVVNRSTSESGTFKVTAIVWYILKKASRMELLEYAIKHPRNQDMFRHALRGTTIEPTEAEG